MDFFQLISPFVTFNKGCHIQMHNALIKKEFNTVVTYDSQPLYIKLTRLCTLFDNFPQIL